MSTITKSVWTVLSELAQEQGASVPGAMTICDAQWIDNELVTDNEIPIPRVSWGETFTPSLRALESNGLLVKRSTVRTINLSYTIEALCLLELFQIYSKLRQAEYWLLYPPYALRGLSTSILVVTHRRKLPIYLREAYDFDSAQPEYYVQQQALPAWVNNNDSLYDLEVSTLICGAWDVS